MTVTDRPVDSGSGGGEGGGPRPPRSGPPPIAALVVLVTLIALVGVVLVVARSDDGTPVSSSATSTTAATVPPASVPATSPSTNPAAPATTATTAPSASTPATVPVDTSSAVWPSASGPVYRTPVAAARGFAVDFVGFTSPIVGAFRQGDARSGEVDVRAKANGPVTTVFVRQLGGDGRWFVLGSATGNIRLASPGALDEVASPVRLRGTSTAFEANVSVEVRQDGARQPIGTGFVMGGSMGEMGPFDGTVSFRRPTAEAGAIVLLTHSAEDGRVWEATTVRVAV